ncbi:hypothetical protein Xcel_1536 [Xylanimonas cellulosilytica DSM 15894]|uniref:Uncharacterized protein n=2 Tax=Xylanimonas TaxID=186188 RepID=D1BS74_XYLCX|nr:hypothetical protein Xcel_1536 [Xylanimonas cellulosilytica DSM 15894]
MQERHDEAAIIDGGDTTVEILKTYAFDEFGGGYPLDIRIMQEDARLLDAQGNLVRDDPGSTGDYRIELLHDGTTWRLVNILTLEDIE